MHIASTSHVRHFEGPLEGKILVAAADLTNRPLVLLYKS